MTACSTKRKSRRTGRFRSWG